MYILQNVKRKSKPIRTFYTFVKNQQYSYTVNNRKRSHKQHMIPINNWKKGGFSVQEDSYR